MCPDKWGHTVYEVITNLCSENDKIVVVIVLANWNCELKIQKLTEFLIIKNNIQILSWQKCSYSDFAQLLKIV